MLDNADFPFPTIKVDGKPVEVTHGAYGMLLQNPDRRVERTSSVSCERTCGFSLMSRRKV